MDQGILAIRLVKIALAAESELSLDDAEGMEIKRAWRLSKQLLDAAEITSFKNVLRHHGD